MSPGAGTHGKALEPAAFTRERIRFKTIKRVAMPAFLDLIIQHLGSGDTVRRIGDQVGAEEEETQRAIAVALPVLLGGLARNANASKRGAEALASALDRDHDGSLLDALGEVLHLSARGAGLGDATTGLPGGYSMDQRTIDGDGILGHLLAERRAAVELGISRASGVDVKKVNRLLTVLAPIVMNILGRLRRERSLSTDGLAALLNKERAVLEREAPDRNRTSLLDFLDADDDGHLADDVTLIGTSLGGSVLLEKLFGRAQEW
jgi:hypothetical protein